jgi:4-hydroxy-2-oxoheptanedioate aldolase
MRALPIQLLTIAALAASSLAGQTAPKPKRINRAIEMLEQGQPIYYSQTNMGGYENGKKMAATKADYITYEMEHGSFDFNALREFMRGLVDAGPTRTGHRTPAVIVTLPVIGLDENYMKANSWVIQQTLAAGVHGILLCHARSPEAIRVMVEAARYPFAEKAAGVGRGLRGSGSQGYAARMWGITPAEYLQKADVWPLNKQGEIMLGLKIEDSDALANAEKVTKVPGIAFAEWGPGDMGFWLVGPKGEAPGRGQVTKTATNPAGLNYPQVMLDARARIFKAVKAANLYFLNSCSESTVVDLIKEGVMICTGGDTKAADVGRAFSKRPQPW